MEGVNPAQVQKFLNKVDYPASKQVLIDHAKDMGADQAVITFLEMLPDQEFSTATEVNEALSSMS